MARDPQVQSRTRSSSTNASSPAQVAANRANAQYSTGPRTAEGKAQIRGNALKHGLYSDAVFLPLEGKAHAEDRAKYEVLVNRMRSAFQPADEFEEDLVDRIAAQQWRLARIMEDRELQRAYLLSEGGWSTVDTVQHANHFGIEEDRITRNLSRMIRDLAFLRRWSMCRPRPHDPAETVEPIAATPEPRPERQDASDPQPDPVTESPTPRRTQSDARPAGLGRPLPVFQGLASESEEQSQPMNDYFRRVAESLKKRY